MSKPDVTILMPCLNERRTLPQCIAMAREAAEELQRLGLESEILISDNGSTDGSVEYARQMGCRVTHCPTKGYGNALIHGCTQARGSYIVMGDSDGSYDFREGVAMVVKLQEGYDLCMGNRFSGEIKKGAMPFMNRYVGNPALSGILNIFYRTGLRDAHSGLRAITKDAFLRLQLSSPGMEFASEMVVKASLRKLRTTEIPITLSPDGRDRPPHLRPWRDGWRHLRFLLLLSPEWLFLLPSALLLTISGLLFACLLTSPSGQMVHVGPFHFGDHWMILAGALFNLGFTGIMFGLISFRHCIQAGFRSKHCPLAKLLDACTLERGITAGVVLVLTGLAIIAYVVGIWYESDFGGLARMREMVLGTTFFITGMQVILGAFILGLFHEKSRPYEMQAVSVPIEPVLVPSVVKQTAGI